MKSTGTQDAGKGEACSVAQRLHQMLARGKSLRIEAAPSSWRGNLPPPGATMMATEIYTGDFVAWLTREDYMEHQRLWDELDESRGAATEYRVPTGRKGLAA